MNTKQRQIAIVVAAVLILVVSVYFVARHFLRKSEPDIAILFLAEPTVCELPDKPCVAGDKRLSVKFSTPTRPVYLKPFPVEIQLEGTEAVLVNHVVLNLSMKGMDMGLNRFVLLTTPEKPGIWQGQVVLPVCVSGRTDWDVEVELGGVDRVYRVHYPLQVTKN